MNPCSIAGAAMRRVDRMDGETGRTLQACDTMVYGMEKSKGCSDERSWYFHSCVGLVVLIREMAGGHRTQVSQAPLEEPNAISHAGSRAWKYSSGWKKVVMERALMRRVMRMWRKRRRLVAGGGLGGMVRECVLRRWMRLLGRR